MSSTMIDHSLSIEIMVGSPINAMAFSADGDYLVSGCDKGVWVLRVEDSKQIATMAADYVQCLAVSQDGRWIAAGTYTGKVIVWSAKTHDAVFAHKEGVSDIRAVDFSPDSTRLVTASLNGTASVWDVATRQRVVGPLHHKSWVIAAKYSSQGDRIATATHDHSSVRVYDSNEGRLLLDVPVKVTSWYNTGLLWSKAHLLTVSGSKIKEIEASTGSAVSEWLAPDNDRFSSIGLSHHGEFIAYSAHRTVTFWDTSTRTQLGLIQHPQDIHSIALSPGNRFLAVGGEGGKITIEYLRDILPPLYFTVPFIDITDAVLDAWKRDRFADAEALLTGIITNSGHANYHALANRALVRAHLRHWDIAIDDANKSVKIRPTVIGYIAKSVALVGGGKKAEGCLVYDFAFRHCHQNGVDLLLLIKAIVLFMAGEHAEAMLRIDALIPTVRSHSPCYEVQAYMDLFLGKLCMENDNYEGAIQLFEHARARLCDHTSRTLFVISLISGWKFDNITITIQRHLCEALFVAGRAKEAGDVVLETVNSFGEEVYMSEFITNWVSDFTQRCLVVPESEGEAASKVVWNDEVPLRHLALGSQTLLPLLNEWAKAKLMSSSWKDALVAADGFTAPRFMIYQVVCERLEAVDRTIDAAECFHQFASELRGGMHSHDEQEKWAPDFKHRCCEKLENIGDRAADTQQYDVAIFHYSVASSLNPTNGRDLLIKRSKARMSMGLWKDALDDANQVVALDPSSPWNHERILIEWTKVSLINGLWKGALLAARDFDVLMPTIYRLLCEGLERVEGMTDAIECFHQMVKELSEEVIMKGEQAEWFRDFRYRCSERLERLGDAAVDSQQRSEAIGHYSAALSIHPANTQGFFILRSKVCTAKGSWEDAIDEANQAITLDPSSPRGYEIKRAALHHAGRYDDAIQTFETMLSKMTHSPDRDIRERRDQYINPSSTRTVIRRVVQRTIRHSPRILINTTTGRLQNKAEQAAAFMSLPIVNELVSSMTTRIDRGHIKREVRQFFRYVMLSHRWEENEPLFHQVIHIAVYDLQQSPTHDKLQIFCKIVREAGFIWAWSDTCCINKQDHFVLQEALVAMFKWYRGSVMTIVFLRGVRSPAKLGDLVRSIWNTRAWTLQEYVAAKVIHFYTEDWTPYLNLEIFNHKESPEIILEMEQATRVSAQQLMALRPGLSSIREKLCLASTRQTTLVEDAAYSLLGIFSVAGISAIYGEGEKSLGRLLAHILAGSGDASILAWTGQSGGYNSCLPAYITVFNQSAMSHLPSPIENAQMEDIVSTLRASALDLDLALKLYDRLNELPAPWFAASRMKLPCIAFKLPPFSSTRTSSGRIYRAETSIFGTVEIKTRQDLSWLSVLYLAHPWLDTLLDHEHTSTTLQGGVFTEDGVAEPSSPNMEDDMSDNDIEDNFGEPSSSNMDDEDMSDEENEDNSSPFPEPLSAARMELAPMDRETRALRLVARLGQSFGALLFTLTSTRRRAVVYRRVAADSMITVKIRENNALADLLDNVRILDVL